MKHSRTLVYAAYIVVGAILVGLAIAQQLDEFWSGMGATLMLMGALRLLREYRFNKNAAYREKTEIAISDERNHFIRSKAWAWAGYLFILISALSVIVLKVLGQETLSMAAAYSVCLMLVLYWISYFILQKKY